MQNLKQNHSNPQTLNISLPSSTGSKIT